jgi:hypothetical protein
VTPAANNKLGKLIRMLSSDKDVEVLAAASAIKRTLAAEGSDIHALADALCRPQLQHRPWHEDDNDWHSIACECQAHSERFSPREQDFVADMVAWTARAMPTDKQQAWLLSIHKRVRRHD